MGCNRVLKRSWSWLRAHKISLLFFMLVVSVFWGFSLVQQGDFGPSAPSGIDYRDFQEKRTIHSRATTLDSVNTRHALMQERCAERDKLKRQGDGSLSATFMDALTMSSQHKFLYCPMAKAGSTFMSRYVMAADRPGPMVSPFQISIKDAARSKLKLLSSLKTTGEKMSFFKESFKFVFTRDPYWRIFSTYIDKLYSPNPYYWDTWGKRAVAEQRLNSSTYPCNSGVLFPQFIKVVLSRLWKSDIHFIPMVTTCQLCRVKYNFVGKMESAIGDIDALSKHFNISSSFQHDENYGMASDRDVIEDSTRDSLHEWLPSLQKCYSLYDLGRIIWRRLQIRGVIYHDLDFPFSPDTMGTFTPETFKAECIKAADYSTDRVKLKKQKIQAFTAAYSLVISDDLSQLQRIYEEDFYVLNYTQKPSIIFNARRENDDPSQDIQMLDWRKKWV